MQDEDDEAGPYGPTRPFSLNKVVRLRNVVLEVVTKAGGSQKHRMTRPMLVVGKGSDADLRIEDRSVSRRHLSIEALQDGLVLRDLGSRNGTWVGGCRIVEAKVVRDTALLVGETSLVISVEQKQEEGLEVYARTTFGGALGVSTVMRNLFVLLDRVARTDGTVLLEGESGTGKEVLARAIHAESARAHAPFVAIDCASIPENLLESELFGHERGAFTGAVKTHIGVFEAASGGTLLLDEVGELPMAQQAKLLRVVETREVRRVGSTRSIPVDVRIVTATNRSLANHVAKKKFRQDLFYRLSVLRVAVPPLRQRKQDIPALARHFLERLRPEATLPPDLTQILLAHSWPGNVRELRNVIERWSTLGIEGPELLFDAAEAGSGTVHVVGDDYSSLPYHEAKRRVLDTFNHNYFPKMLKRAGGVVTRAAELAEVPRPSFHRMLVRARAPEENDDIEEETTDIDEELTRPGDGER